MWRGGGLRGWTGCVERGRVEAMDRVCGEGYRKK